MVKNQSGLAMIVAGTEEEALRHLRESGLYNGSPELYVLIESRNLGEYVGCEYGLILESYTNALLAFDAICSIAEKIKGEKGDKGDKGNKGDTGEQGLPGGIAWPELYVDGDLWLHIVEPDNQLSARLDYDNGWLIVRD